MRQGDELVYLSPLRHASNAGLNVRSLLTRTNDPAVQAILGARGIFYAEDYRAKEVIAMASAVPDSPWLVVSKIDEAEVMANTRNRELLALGLPILFGLTLIGAMFALWQQQAWRRERKLKAVLERNMRWLESAQKTAAIGYFSYDVAKKRFLLSRMVDDLFGSNNKLVDLSQWVDMIHPDDRQFVLEHQTQAVKQLKPLRIQYRIVGAHDGQVRWVQVWGELELNEKKDRVVRMIGTAQDITERKQTEDELSRYRAALEEKVRLDPLTQIANRRALDEQLGIEWQRAMRRQTPMAFLMVDVDYFKLYNDHYGHLAGDDCLKKVAQAIAASVNRAGELAVRYGGEEFAVLLPESDLERAMQTAERILQAIRTLDIAHASSVAAPYVTVSIGVVSVQPVFVEATAMASAGLALPDAAAHITSGIQRMIHQADDALYLAKQQGRNQAVPHHSAVA